MADPLDEIREAARAALAPVEGELAVAGLAEPVEVLRDRWGIPYLSAASLDDLWFAQGYVQASERLFQIELALRASAGRLSEWFADLAVPSDRFARTVGFARLGVREAGRWSASSVGMMRRFVEGARAFAASAPAPPIEYTMLASTPELPEDLGAWAAAFAYLAWGLSGNWDRELLRLRLAERKGPAAVETLLPPLPEGPTELAAASLAGRLLDGLPRSAGQGSNGWVVSGARTASGSPLLANDPHLLVQQPPPWFEIHLRAPGYEARGVAFAFAPGVVAGTTAHHAWGITNVSGDVQDLYLERLSDDGSSAQFDGGWEPLTIRTERIEVRGAAAIVLEVRETRHGPLLDSVPVGSRSNEFVPVQGTLALRWTAADGLLEPSSLIDIVRAGSFDSFREALRGVSCPGQNVLYADVDGTIGLQCTGLYPLRRAGDGSAPAAGWTAEHEWDGYVPFDDLPWSRDPGPGYLVAANNRIHDEDYPHLIGLDVHVPIRALRIAERLGAMDVVTSDACAAIQVDTMSLAARRLLPHLLGAAAGSDRAREAIERLGRWDGDLASGSREAAVYETWLGAIARTVLARDEDPETFDAYYAAREAFVCSALPGMLEGGVPPPGGGTWGELLGSALEVALDRLGTELGPDPGDWRWGSLHRARFAHPLARLPGLGALFVAAEHEIGGDEQTVLQSGVDGRLGFEATVVPSWRQVVDLSNVDATLAVMSTGQSGNPASPYWSDQSSLWAAGELRPCPFTRPAVEEAAEKRLVLMPG
ncbi:MAG TPA: penicillin acylase family protein [Actinomycetota bacterium]|nr:penicillin acylase family protein [Actinomycetota bacterium]